MAQASSAQREPSMEEILASIRRIIEDNDSDETEASAVDSATSDVAAAAAETGGEIETFRAELNATPQEPADTGGTSGAPSRLSDIKDSLPEDDLAAAELSNDAGQGTATAQQPTVFEDATYGSPRQEPDEAVAPAASAPAPEYPSDAPVSTPGVSEAASWSSNAPASGDAKPPIISEVAGRKVAAAFEELSEAFEASRRKSFDEMAEEMLRPMLREWLDNNLPTLVEKMVREEIERVARGDTR